jgi:monoamine oxidase
MTSFDNNKIVGIVGGGLAGLTIAYRLSNVGIKSILFEGSNRLGGRAYTGTFPNGQTFEHGGEFIDTDHTEIINLVNEFGLELKDLKEKYQSENLHSFYNVVHYPDIDDNYNENNEYSENNSIQYPYSELANDYFNKIIPNIGLSVYQLITKHAESTYPTNTDPSSTPWPLQYGDPILATYLDRITLNEYINDITSFLRKDGNGAKTKLGQILKVSYTTEFGSEVLKQSPLNLIYLLGFQTAVNTPNLSIPSPSDFEAGYVPLELFEIYGVSNERYHIKGGTSQLVNSLVENLTNVDIRLNNKLVSIVHRNDLEPIDVNGNRPYEIIVETNDGYEKFIFGNIVSAIPFTTLKLVDLKKSDISELKNYAIQNLELCKCAKLNMQFKNRYWNIQENSGEVFTTSNPEYTNDRQLNFQYTYDESRAQDGETGIICQYTGGNFTDKFLTSESIKDKDAFNTYTIDITNQFLNQFTNFCPTTENNFSFNYDEITGKINNVNSTNWTYIYWQQGAYSYWQKGQYIGGEGKIIDGIVIPSGSVVPFAGYEGVAEPYNEEQTGNFHFAGEHTSYTQQGFLNGAVQSGERVSKEIIKALTQ